MFELVESWLWFIRDSETGRLRISRHRLTVDEARTLHPGATQVPGSMEVIERELSKDAELGATLHGWFYGKAPAPLDAFTRRTGEAK